VVIGKKSKGGEKIMEVGLKPKLLFIVAIVLGLSLSDCRWMMAPMRASHSRQNKSKERVAQTFWEKIATANTPQEHRAIAKAYRQNAEDYRLLAKKHARRKAAYQGYKEKPGADEATAEFMIIHCQRLVEKFTELVEETEA